MKPTPILGKLSKVDPRGIWEHEALSFTPWLAQPENLAQLGEALGIQLELEAQEQSVGPFRADILCKRVGTTHWVLIENQLERTDHTHLGQILTYAAGLDAVTVIWISPQFTDEHRACLDWLNRCTTEELNFFGIEIEAWKIGDSPPAARFNVVSKPNQWSKSVATASASIVKSEIKQTQLEYWTAFREVLLAAKTPINPVSSRAENYISMSPFGRSGFALTASTDRIKKTISVAFYLSGKPAPAYFQSLTAFRPELDSKFGKLLWFDGASQERMVIYYLGDVDPTDRSDWPRQHQWLIEQLSAFYKVFAPIVRELQPAPTEFGIPPSPAT